MCGRFASARKRQELLEEFGVQRDRVTESLRPDYNVAPTKPVYAVVTRRAEDTAKEHGAGPDEAGPDGPAAGGARPAAQAAGHQAASTRRPGTRRMSTRRMSARACGNSGWSAGGWCPSGPRTSRSAAA